MIRGIVFDFDGLIIDTESAWYEALADLFGGYGVELPFDLWVRCVGASHAVFDPYAYFQERRPGVVDAAELRKSALERHAAIMAGRPLRDGVEDYMRTARRLGLSIGIASSSRLDWIEGYLAKFGLAGYIDSIRCADHVAEVKPSPEVYQKAVESLGLSPEEAIAFEDSPNGARAAFRAGLNVVIVPNRVTERLEFGPHLFRLQSMGDMPLEAVIERVARMKNSVIR